MIQITADLVIPESELSFSASRSGGPGGQNVNKVSTKVTLSFDLRGSAALSEDQKTLIADRLSSRINKEGIIQVVSQRTRSQELNRADAVARFSELMRRALAPRRARLKTRPTAASQRQRLDEKKKRSVTKQRRSGKEWDS